MKTELWVEPISTESPCGESLEYSAEFLKLQELATGLPERQYGKVVIPAEPPDWGAVFEAGDKLLRLSKDMRIVSVMARAAIGVNGLVGFATILDVADQLTERYWNTLHPALEFEGQADPIMRVNAIAELSAPEGTLRDLRSAVFVQSKGFSISVRQAEVALSPSERQGSTETMSREQLSALVADAIRSDPRAFDSLEVAHGSATRLRQRCIEQLGSSVAPDLSPLVNALIALLTCVMHARHTVFPVGHPESTSNDAGTDLPRAPAGRGIGVIQTRQDAFDGLVLICDYFERNEPASPVPILIRRAQRLIGMKFVDIMRDMAPDSMSRIDIIAGETSN
jgi:type VI secretion system protein ImpA